jgi:hypothetical protein
MVRPAPATDDRRVLRRATWRCQSSFTRRRRSDRVAIRALNAAGALSYPSDVVGRRRVLVFLAVVSMVGCAAILGREEIVLEEETLRPDSSDDRATGVDDANGGEADDALNGDGTVTVMDAGDAGPTCPGVDASCDLATDAGCCPGMECRNLHCSPCIALNGGCVSGGNTRCCGSAVCARGNVCSPCLEAGASCEITEPQECCSKNCSPVNGCF